MSSQASRLKTLMSLSYFELRAEKGLKGGKVCLFIVPTYSQVLFVLTTPVSTHTFSPTATIRQLQSVAAGNKLEFTSLE